MAGLTPKNALQNYRLNADEITVEQARLIRKMHPKDALELLFYMATTNVKITQFLHDKIDPGGAETEDMPENPIN